MVSFILATCSPGLGEESEPSSVSTSFSVTLAGAPGMTLLPLVLGLVSSAR